MNYTMAYIDGRLYRYSRERRISGRPASIQFQNGRGEWRDVRNIDRSDAIWKLADDRRHDPIGDMLMGRGFAV